MPAFNFKKQFAQAVKNKTKRQTIRAYRKDYRNPQAGDVLYLYTGMRTKNCQKLGEEQCNSVSEIEIHKGGGIMLDGEMLTLLKTAIRN